MIVRNITKEDLDIIQMMNDNQKDFRLDTIKNAIIDKIVLEDDETPIAYGIVKHLAEAIMINNPEVNLNSRIKAMRELMQYAEFGAKQAGCEQLHCFVQDEKLARTLMKHYGFLLTKDFVLVKNL